MTPEEQRYIFAYNLKRQLSIAGMSRQEFADKIGTNYKTVCGWLNEVSVPKVGKIQTIADLLGIGKSDLLDEQECKTEEQYYNDKEAAEYAEFLRQNPDYKVLFDASRKVKKEDLEKIARMIEAYTSE